MDVRWLSQLGLRVLRGIINYSRRRGRVEYFQLHGSFLQFFNPSGIQVSDEESGLGWRNQILRRMKYFIKILVRESRFEIQRGGKFGFSRKLNLSRNKLWMRIYKKRKEFRVWIELREHLNCKWARKRETLWNLFLSKEYSLKNKSLDCWQSSATRTRQFFCGEMKVASFQPE